MSSDDSTDGSESEPLAPKTITSRFDNLDTGDSIRLNNREQVYEVVDTDTYSVIVEDVSGQRVTVSQNLQTGGWTISEEVFHVKSKE